MAECSPAEDRVWELIRIDPVRWKESGYGAETDGFWAVAVFGNQVLWYNEIEDGFNLSRFDAYSEIAEYWCDQLDLVHILRRIAGFISEGTAIYTGRYGPPLPV